MHGIKSKDVEILVEPNGINLAKLAVEYADGIIKGTEELNPEVEAYIGKRGLPVLPYTEISTDDTGYIQKYNNFYDQILSTNVD